MEYRRIIQKRKIGLISSVVLFIILSTGFAFRKAYPPLYSSTCSIRFEKALTLEGLFSRTMSWTEGDNIETQQAIITGYDLLTEVAKNLSLIRQTASVNDPGVTAVVEGLKSKIHVVREKDTNIINISVTDTEPSFAQALANELAETYSRWYSGQQEKRLAEVIGYIGDQLRTMKNNLKNSEERLSRFSQDNQLISVDLQGENLILRKKEIEDRIRVEKNTKRANELKLQLQELDEKINLLLEKKLEFNRLKREIDSYRSMIAFLEEKNQDALIKQAERPDEVDIVKQARLPVKPVNPPDFAETGLTGIIAGIAFGLILVFFLEAFDNSIRIVDKIEKTLDARIMGIIPRADIKKILATVKNDQDTGPEKSSSYRYLNLVSHFAPKTTIAESFRAMRTNIRFATEKEKTKTITVTSSHPQEGKSMVSVNLAISMAQAGLKTLLVGSDIRNPMLAKICSVENSPGLSDILLGACPWEDSIKTVTDMIMGGMTMDDVMMTPGLDNLNIITSGEMPHNPAELINSQKFKEFLKAAQKDYDIVILDSSPLLSTADAAILCAQVDAVLVVHRPETVSRGTLKRTITQLKQLNCNLMGIVLNNVNPNMIPGALRNKYTGKHSSGARTGASDIKTVQKDRKVKDKTSMVFISLIVLVLLVSLVWWQRDMIFPERFFQSGSGAEKGIETPVKVRPEKPEKNEVSPDVKKDSLKNEAPPDIEEPEKEETAPVTEESPGNIEKPASAQETVKPEYIEGRYPYSIYLGSFKNMERAHQAVEIYARKGIPSYRVKINFTEKGTWYRIYSGHYPDRESARAFIDRNKIADAEIKKTAYACYIGSFTDNESLENQMRLLRERHYSPYIIDDAANMHSVFVGAFITRGAAEELNEELHAAGIAGRVVHR